MAANNLQASKLSFLIDFHNLSCKPRVTSQLHVRTESDKQLKSCLHLVITERELWRVHGKKDFFIRFVFSRHYKYRK